MNDLLPDRDREDVEGLGPDEESSWGDYPIDTLLIRNENRTVHDVLRRIAQGSFVMDPDFQRAFIWPQDKQSKLIESVLMRIPLPVFYLAEDIEGRMVVVDGLQRLYTFQRFVNNELRLRLPEQSELDGRRFQDLTPKLQNRVEDCNLVLYIIDAKVPERARLDIFDRVNSGVPLTRQQMRNSLYTGPATRFLRCEAETECFLEATGGSLNPKTMRDREFVNRFCAFQILAIDEFRGDMDEFLAEVLRRLNDAADEFLKALSLQFQLGLANNFMLFGKHAFRKHTEDRDRRSPLNASLWDVMSTTLSHYPTALVKARGSDVKNAFFALTVDNDFVNSITYSVNSVKSVKHRFATATAAFGKVLDDHSA